MRDLAGSVPEMLEPCRNKDCVFQGGRNREEPYIVDALNASRREESVVRPSSSAIVTGLRAIQKQRLRIGPAKRPLVRRSGTGSRFSPRHWKPLPMAKSKRKESRRRSLSYQISNNRSLQSSTASRRHDCWMRDRESATPSEGTQLVAFRGRWSL